MICNSINKSQSFKHAILELKSTTANDVEIAGHDGHCQLPKRTNCPFLYIF